MKRIFTLSLFVLISKVVFTQVIPCNCECSGRLDLVSGNGYYLLDSVVSFAWDDPSGDWQQTGTSVYYYDEFTRKTGNAGYRSNRNTGLRTPSYKTDYLYGDSGEKTGYRQYRWQEETGQWEENQRIELTYNDSGKLTGQVIRSLKDGQWQTEYRASYIYNTKGFSQVFEKEKWNEANRSWEKVFRTTYTKEGRTTTAVSYNFKNNDWVPVSRNISINNDHGVLAETVNDRWDPERNDWQTQSSSAFLFDAKGNKTEWISSGEDKLSGKQVIRGHQLYHYDEEGKLSEVMGVSEDQAKGTVRNNSRKVYYWSLHSVSGLKGELSGKLKIFPNPFKYFTTVELPGPAKRIDLLDTRGRVVRTWAGITSPTLRIDKKDLLPAIYFLRVYGDKVYMAKMVVY